MPSYFLAGVQKAATSWIYYNLAEHPEIFVPENNTINYFNVNYYKGEEWYHSWFNHAKSDQVIVDPTMTYFRDYLCHQRMYDYNPNAKIVVSFRNPIDRAFSHYWHEKKKGKIDLNFDEAVFYEGVGNYDFFNEWVQSGFYYYYLQNLMELFNEDQVKVMIYEDIESNPLQFMQSIYKFMDVNPDFEPPLVAKKANVGGQRRKSFVNKVIFWGLQALLPQKLVKKTQEPGTIEYKRGMSSETRGVLKEIFEPENQKLARLLNRDLSFWC